MQQRQEDFDYDIVPGRFSMSLSPSIELRQLFSSDGADAPGSVNLSGVADPVVDALIEKVIEAETREELDVRVRALDRVLRAMQNLGAELVQRQVPGRLLGRVRPPRDQPPYARGDDDLVVRPGEVRRAEGRGRAALTGA